MSIHEVESAISALRSTDSRIESPGFCRFAAIMMKKVAEEANISDPKPAIEIIAWPDAIPGEEVHYAIRAREGEEGESIVFNPSPTPGFPEYKGPFKKAPGRIKEMKVTKKVA